jgi:hypothetical protein
MNKAKYRDAERQPWNSMGHEPTERQMVMAATETDPGESPHRTGSHRSDTEGHSVIDKSLRGNG